MIKWLKASLESLTNKWDRWMGQLMSGSAYHHRVDAEMMDVREFFHKFNFLRNNVPVHLTKRKLKERIELMQEELNEFKLAAETQNLAEQADALIDLVYVAKGTAVMLGLPWEELWDDVHSANMDKLAGVGKRGHAFDVIKPAGWIPPQTELILMDHGYRRNNFADASGVVNEELCYDDAHIVH